MLFSEKIIFPVGILVGNKLFTEAVLEEENFGHTLRASTMTGLDTSRMEDEGYFSAAKLAIRLTVPGLFEARMEHDEDFKLLVEDYAEVRDIKVKAVTAAKIHPVSAEIVEGLHRVDGRVLLAVSAILEERRAEFRKNLLTNPDGHPGAAKDGVLGKRGAGEEPGGSESDS